MPTDWKKWTVAGSVLLIPLLSLLQFARLFHSSDLFSKHLGRSVVSIASNTTAKHPEGGYSSNQTVLSTSSSSSFNITIDVVSIGSLNRPDYLQAQFSTWGQHPSIRWFINVTENDDLYPDCPNNTSLTQVKSHVQQCRKLHSSTPFLSQYKYFPPRFVLRKSNPAGWLCAQVRPGSGIGKIGRLYRNKILDDLPSYVFLIDDDTMVNVDMFLQTIVRRDARIPIVFAGCLTILQHLPYYRYSPYGGAGTFWSRGSIERLLQPIYCNGSTTNDQRPDLAVFVQNVCKRIQENLILEQPLFEEGMRMFEFVEKVFHNHPNCFHSDWLVGHFVQYYYLSSEVWEDHGGYLHPLNDESVQYYYNNLQNNTAASPIGKYCALSSKTCDESHLLCHYVTPEIMRNVNEQWNATTATKQEVT
jgi:hypothetical protein